MYLFIVNRSYRSRMISSIKAVWWRGADYAFFYFFLLLYTQTCVNHWWVTLNNIEHWDKSDVYGAKKNMVFGKRHLLLVWQKVTFLGWSANNYFSSVSISGAVQTKWSASRFYGRMPAQYWPALASAPHPCVMVLLWTASETDTEEYIVFLSYKPEYRRYSWNNPKPAGSSAKLGSRPLSLTHIN